MGSKKKNKKKGGKTESKKSASGSGKPPKYTRPSGPAARLTQLRKELRRNDLDAIVVTHMPTIRYLSRFSGSAGTLLVAAKDAWLLTDGRYAEQVGDEVVEGVQPIITRQHFQQMRDEKLVRKGMRVGFHAGYTSVAGHRMMAKAFGRKVELVEASRLTARLTVLKSDEDVTSIRRAANIAAKVYRQILTIVKPGMRELDVAAEISYLGRKAGSEGDAFDIIVASGARSALPHGRASMKKIAKGDLVTLDFGCIVDGFNSDMTRTFAVGEPGDKAREVYNTVLEAERAGVAAARAGMTARELDGVCRSVIDEKGYGEFFSHSTGHGLGYDVHEMPPLATRADDSWVLQEGMVVTIEPGIYLPGEFGVRIEDDVLIEKDGCRELTSPSRRLTIV